MNKEPIVKKKDDAPFELESQFILRLPQAPAEELRKVLRSGANNLKDRLTIQLESDMRHGTVRFDNWIFSAKLVDLPCIVETHKTIDRKTFYKTADICQMLSCRDAEETPTTEDEEPTTKKKDKKDNVKVDKKYLWPHGITPPLKNVRKRRYRKTLKKKYVDAPEIEKEVKRLFRIDNEAVKVSWELINDSEEITGKGKQLIGESQSSSVTSPTASGALFSNSQSLDIAEHDIFGEVVSSSEDEGDVNIIDSGDDETSRMSSGVPTQTLVPKAVKKDLVTEFKKGMLQGSNPETKDDYIPLPQESMPSVTRRSLDKTHLISESKEDILGKLNDLRHDLNRIQNRRQAHELEIASIENQALKQRFQGILDSIIIEEKEKQRKYDELSMLIQGD